MYAMYIPILDYAMTFEFHQCIDSIIICTRQVTRATHVRNRVCPRVELILKIIIIFLIIYLGFIQSKPQIVNRKQ